MCKPPVWCRIEAPHRRKYIRYAAINAWRDRNRRRQKEISFEYLTEEKFYPLSASDECILQLRGLRPFFSPKYDLKQHPNYRYTAEADKKNAFDLSRLIQRRMDKLDPSEQYTVYEADVPDKADIGEDEDIFNYDDLDDPDAFV